MFCLVWSDLFSSIKSAKFSIFTVYARVAEVVQGHGGPPPKSLDWDENFKPEHTKFFRAIFAPDERPPSSATLVVDHKSVTDAGLID